jgi:hypothetical protein
MAKRSTSKRTPSKGSKKSSAGGRSTRGATTTTDHEEIRRWAESRGAKPSCVRGTGGGDDTGMIRLDFPGYSGEESLQPIDWDQWFEAFDENGLALLYQQNTAGGQQSNFNKLVSRDGATKRRSGGASGGRSASRAKSSTRGRASSGGSGGGGKRPPSRAAAAKGGRNSGGGGNKSRRGGGGGAKRGR